MLVSKPWKVSCSSEEFTQIKVCCRKLKEDLSLEMIHSRRLLLLVMPWVRTGRLDDGQEHGIARGLEHARSMKTRAVEQASDAFPLRSANNVARKTRQYSVAAVERHFADARPTVFDALQYSYRGFLLRCKPQPTPSGRYLAFVVILCNEGGLRTVGSVTAELPSFADYIDAVWAGLAAGRSWVDLRRAKTSPSRGRAAR